MSHRSFSLLLDAVLLHANASQQWILNTLQWYTLPSLCPPENSLRPEKARVSLFLLRNPLCRSSSVSSSLSPRQRVMNCQLFAQQRAWGPVTWPGERTLGETTGADNPETSLYLDCKGIKAMGFLCSGCLLGSTSSSCYFII